jgi:hypothetical protein
MGDLVHQSRLIEHPNSGCLTYYAFTLSPLELTAIRASETRDFIGSCSFTDTNRDLWSGRNTFVVPSWIFSAWQMDKTGFLYYKQVKTSMEQAGFVLCYYLLLIRVQDFFLSNSSTNFKSVSWGYYSLLFYCLILQGWQVLRLPAVFLLWEQQLFSHFTRSWL